MLRNIIFKISSGACFSCSGAQTLIRKGNGEKYGNYEKLNDLLSTFNLNNREIKTISDLDFILNSKIDYKSVNEIIAINRKNTLEYLKSNI